MALSRRGTLESLARPWPPFCALIDLSDEWTLPCPNYVHWVWVRRATFATTQPGPSAPTSSAAPKRTAFGREKAHNPITSPSLGPYPSKRRLDNLAPGVPVAATVERDEVGNVWWLKVDGGAGDMATENAAMRSTKFTS